MPSSSDVAHGYREGFVEGVSAVLSALGDDLPEDQRRILEKWVSGPLAAWRSADAEAQRPPAPLLDGA